LVGIDKGKHVLGNWLGHVRLAINALLVKRWVGWERWGKQHTFRQYIQTVPNCLRCRKDVVILGLPTADTLRLRWGQLLVNLYINPKLIFYDSFSFIYPISMGLWQTGSNCESASYQIFNLI